MKQLIKKLVEATGPSGYEHQVREIIRAEVEPYADDIREDALGNLIVRKGQKTDAGKTIMVAGHMDEIGIMATHINDKGFISFTNIGGVNPRNLYGSRVRFLDGLVGVIGYKVANFSKSFTIEKPSLDMMFIDVGSTSKEDCPVKVGDVAAFDRPFEDLGDRLVSKAMDDRIATAVMVQGLKDLKDSVNEVFFVFTTQEEVGLRGATTSAYGINPEIGLAIDVTPIFDTPGGKGASVFLGKGPALKMRDSSLVVDPKMIEWTSKAAEKIGIPYQYEVLPRGGTDAGAINLSRGGVPATCLSIPTRYVHSPSEMVDYNDVLNTVRLLVELVSKPVELG
ncbi:MAG: M42 family metallopeptidase [Anaerolineaceae bacterium]|nr:M42 family metallopeptidase [Anaerolineaceae bacterium]